MKKYSDKQGLFGDFNFKLVVVSALLDKNPSFETELEELREKCHNIYEENEDSEYEPIEEMCEYISSLELKREELDAITELCFDGGGEIYFYLLPDWDGEEDFFDVKSVEGFEHLRNLKKVEYISMTEEKILEPMKRKGVEIF